MDGLLRMINKAHEKYLRNKATDRYDLAKLLTRIVEELGLEGEYSEEQITAILRNDSHSVQRDIDNGQVTT